MSCGRIRAFSALITLLCACGPQVSSSADTRDESESGRTTGGPVEPNPSGTTGLRLDLGDDGSTSICAEVDDDGTVHPRCTPPTSSDTGSSDTINFILPTTGCDIDPNFPGAPRCSPGQCLVIDQDCPAGEKCSPWANDGGDVWNATRCSPVDPMPSTVGQPCVVEGSGVSGVDSCDGGSMCWDVDPATNEGICVAWCIESDDQPACADDSLTCVVANEGALPLCLTPCDPRDPVACGENEGCYPTGEAFVCLPFGAQVFAEGSGCEFPAHCEPGTLCVADEVGPQCDDPPCCSAWCDTMDPDACTLGETCTALYEAGQAPTGFDTLGFCETNPGG